MSRNLLRRHRLTADEYHRMGHAGILRSDARVELIEGEVIDMAPIGSRHAGTVEQLAEILRLAVGNRAMVRTQQPVSLGEHSEPEPDIVLVVHRSDYYKTKHPRAADVLLAIEVADASLAYDREVKVPLYARHAVPETWIVDVDGQRLLRHWNPAGGAYADTDSPSVERPVAPRALADVFLDLRAVF